MASPTGRANMPGAQITAPPGVWTSIGANPNMAKEVIVTTTEDIYIQFERDQPLPAEVGMRVHARTYYGKEFTHWIGYNRDGELITIIEPAWVRPVDPATTAIINSDWFRE